MSVRIISVENVLLATSISAKVGRCNGDNESQASDLWFAFLAENGLAQASEIFSETCKILWPYLH